MQQTVAGHGRGYGEEEQDDNTARTAFHLHCFIDGVGFVLLHKKTHDDCGNQIVHQGRDCQGKELIEFDMISHQQIDDTFYLLEDEIDTIERMFRLHQDFGINTQGLDIINEMLLRIEEMESEILYLKKRLSLYE